MLNPEQTEGVFGLALGRISKALSAVKAAKFGGDLAHVGAFAIEFPKDAVGFGVIVIESG